MIGCLGLSDNYKMSHWRTSSRLFTPIRAGFALVVFSILIFLPFIFHTAKALVNDNLDSYDPEAKCPHNEIMYNVKLMGGLKAGKFTDIGKVKSIKTCIRYVKNGHCFCHTSDINNKIEYAV